LGRRETIENRIDFYDHLGWKVKEIRYIGEESEKLGRPAPYPRWAKLRKLNGYAVLEPKKK
jgi:hypothetical protein